MSIHDLMNAVYEAKGKLSEAEDSRDRFLEPILVALGATGGGIDRCDIDGERIHIGRAGSCRGNRWDDDYTFPLAIFTCKDPLKAAADYVAAKKAGEEASARRDKLATIQRLQNELAK